MLIVWGEKLVYQKQGYVADFCPQCRKISAFELNRVGMAGHLYHVTFSEGRFLRYEGTCQKCRAVELTELARYAAVAEKMTTLHSLSTKTFPKIAEVYEERLRLEETIRLTPAFLPPEAKNTLMLEPFLRVSPEAQRRIAASELDAETSITIVLAITGVVLVARVILSFAPQFEAEVVWSAVGLSGAIIFWQVMTSGSRYLRRLVTPKLAAELQPLKPTESEIVAVLAELKRRKHILGAKLKPADLVAQIKLVKSKS
jgi:hypothetical protein